jgi:molybdopterin synthase sulfur carrier subunit
MKVKLLYFAGLREQLGKPGEELELSAAMSTVAGLRTHLMARGGAWQSALAQGKALRVAVNQEVAQPATPVKPGDEVAFFPPVTGG